MGMADRLSSCPSCGRTLDRAPTEAGRCGHCQAPLPGASGRRRPVSTRADALTPGSSPGISHVSLSEASQHLQGPARDLAEEVARARTDPRRAFGHFLILSELGKGGMGVVFRAWDDRLKRLTALKTLGSAGDAQAIKRFQREAEAVARLRHPGIVSVFEAGELGGQQFLAMEFIEGRTLEQRLQGVRVEGSTHPDDGEGSRSRKTRIALHKALEAVRDAARAVHYAHEQGVIHRDLKPQNIMLDRADRAHVLDFGLALVNDSQDARITKAGTRIGTLAYMSPEQATGQPLDARSDVWSLGATLYTVLTNRCPFEAESELALLAALTSVDPSPPSAHNPRARGDLDVICLRCLEKEREKRYPSAAALADDLDRHLAGEPI